MRLAGTTPRATDPAYHKKIVDEIVGNLGVLESSGLFDDIYLYTRSGNQVYPVEGKSAADALREHLFGDRSDEELEHYRYLAARLDRLKDARA